MSLRIACAQLNLLVGDMPGNVERIVAAAEQALDAGAQLLLTPALSVCGAFPADNLLRPAFQWQVDQAVEQIRQVSSRFKGLYWVVGYPVVLEGQRFEAAGVFHEGRQLTRYLKAELSGDGVLDEGRYLRPAAEAAVFRVADVRCAVLLGEEVRSAVPLARAKAAGAELVLTLAASPYQGAPQARSSLAASQQQLAALGMAAVVCQPVGGQDELLFSGQSHAIDAAGQLCARAGIFTEELLLVDVARAEEALVLHGVVAETLPPLAETWQALVLAIRDYVGKNGFGGVIIGLSGGIDSALVAALAVDALGASRVRSVMMPSPYTAEISLADAADMAQRLGIRHEVLPIQPCFDAFRSTLASTFAGLPEDTTEENIQARIRGTLLMAMSNKTGWVVLTTSNKSESAVGYATLYGDMAGGFAPLKDLLKTQVYALSRYRNGLSEVIPERIITRAPSAELRPDQTDQDSLPPYEVLDRIIVGYMEENRPAAELVAEGLPVEAVAQVVRLLRLAEYKRQQGPVGPKLSRRAFGRDWRYPITSGFREAV
ncbi:MAG: NAD+ synthase [Lautropia sp.]|nr:NAD+ synthase [Lautropia sp.]